MTRFVQPPDDDYAVVYLESTDAPLPEKINQSTRYIHFKTIARGGKAIIQSCKDLHLQRTVCYKKLKPELADDPIEQQRFVREARVSAMLQHPNTVPMYELGRDNRGHLYFTMKLVHGYTLREVLDYRERYDLQQLINVVTQVAYALQYAHSHRVIHRDIKPENILVGPFGEVLVLDWGLAKVWSEAGRSGDEASDTPIPSDEPVSTMTGQAKLEGTVTYMSPEQIRRDPDIDFRTDIYSLGVVLYEILAGKPPIEADTVRHTIEAILTVVPQSPCAIAAWAVPPLLERVALRCLAKDPVARLPDCGEFIRLMREDWRRH
ncbi:MAG: serine/threonine-protein kinase [Pseudomonadota bacterium]